jgi:hypothetical protein
MSLLKWCESNNSNLVYEWDEANEMAMNEIGSSSGIKVKWICSRCGFHFEQRPSDRVRGHGCPKCARKSHSSVPETICYLAIKQYFSDAIHGYKTDWLGRKELDIFIPSISVGIEYDGNSWHNKSRKRTDNDKTWLCAQHNILIYRIRENGCEPMDDESNNIYYKPSKQYNALKYSIIDVLMRLGHNNVAFDDWESLINKSKCEFSSIERSKSIGVINPEFSAKWDYDKNYPLTPYDILAHSNHKVWLRCDKGHLYKRAPNYSNQKECPICINKIVLEGYNDLATIRPDLALDWNYDRNGELKPTEITFGSNRRIWWKCHACGNEFQSSPNARKDNMGHCSKCVFTNGNETLSKNKAVNNSLAEFYPEIAKEWDYNNNERTPDNVARMSGLEAWWICSNGHSWKASVHSRTHDGKKCPYCKQTQTINC